MINKKNATWFLFKAILITPIMLQALLIQGSDRLSVFEICMIILFIAFCEQILFPLKNIELGSPPQVKTRGSRTEVI